MVHDAAPTVLHCRDGRGQVLSSASRVSSTYGAWYLDHRVRSLSHQIREFSFSWSESPSGDFSTWPYRPDWWSGAEMVILEVSLFSTNQQWSSVRVTLNFLIICLTTALWLQALVLPEASVLIGTFNAAEMFPLPRSVSWFNPVSEVGTQLVGLHGFVCALTCTVNYGALDRCGIQSAGFITSHVTLHRLSVETELSWPQVWVS